MDFGLLLSTAAGTIAVWGADPILGGAAVTQSRTTGQDTQRKCDQEAFWQENCWHLFRLACIWFSFPDQERCENRSVCTGHLLHSSVLSLPFEKEEKQRFEQTFRTHSAHIPPTFRTGISTFWPISGTAIWTFDPQIVIHFWTCHREALRLLWRLQCLTLRM